MEVEYLIIGGGISGCAAAQKLQDHGEDYLLVEKNIELGGLTRSISIGDTLFDYTGHFLHLSHWDSPSQIPYADQKDEDWQIVKRNSSVYLEGTFAPAPFQYNLFYLPDQKKDKCINSYRNRPQIEAPISFKEYLLTNFGSEICSMFLFPYNEKILDINLDHLSLDSIKRFFPEPSDSRIENGYAKFSEDSYDYNSKFWYPKNNGIGLLTKGLANGIKNVLYGEEIIKLDLGNNIAFTRKLQIHYKKLISSIPLKELCLRTNERKLIELGRQLSHNKVLSLNLLNESKLPDFLKDKHWIYFPDKKIPFYRVGIYSNIPNSHFRPGTNAFYIETSIKYNKEFPELHNLIKTIIDELYDLNWIRKDTIRVIAANWIEYAYVHFDFNRESVVRRIRSLLNVNNVSLIGRYGIWDYISMEDSILSGLNSIDESGGFE